MLMISPSSFKILTQRWNYEKHLKKFHHFSSYVAGIWSLKGVETAVCRLKNIDITKDAVKIIGINFLYNKAIQNDLNFIATISKIQAVLKLCSMQSLERKIIVFKSLAISKIVCLSEQHHRRTSENSKKKLYADFWSPYNQAFNNPKWLVKEFLK